MLSIQKYYLPTDDIEIDERVVVVNTINMFVCMRFPLLLHALHGLLAKSEEDVSIWWHLDEAVVGEDGSVVLAGGGTFSPQFFKIDADGELEWKTKVRKPIQYRISRRPSHRPF